MITGKNCVCDAHIAPEREEMDMNHSAFIIPESSSQQPHFEVVNDRRVLYVDGRPFTALTVEIPWWDLIDGRYEETHSVYDALYPAASAMGLNTIKVPVKWSMIETKKGKYDFRYVDHVKSMAEKSGLKVVLGWFGHYASGDGNIYRNLTGEVFAPTYVIEDDETYPRAVDKGGTAHHNCISYAYDAVIDVETEAFKAFMTHVKKVDEGTHTIIMVQVENEIAVFGADRQNRNMWRDHSLAANQAFEDNGFTDDLKFSAWSLSSRWIRKLTEEGNQIYPLPFFANFVGGKLKDGLTGGSPGEDVSTYLEHCPHLDFCGLNLYVQPGRSINDLRGALNGYKTGRNLPSITETNSDLSKMAPRIAYLSIGEYGAPIFAPWALNTSCPTPYQPYVLEDGSTANGAPGLKECYDSINMAMSQISYYAGTDNLKVFMGVQPGDEFSYTIDMKDTKLVVGGETEGQAMILHVHENEFLVIGYRCHVSISTPYATWPALKNIQVEKGSWKANEWSCIGEARYTINQSKHAVGVSLDTAQVVRIHLNKKEECPQVE